MVTKTAAGASLRGRRRSSYLDVQGDETLWIEKFSLLWCEACWLHSCLCIHAVISHTFPESRQDFPDLFLQHPYLLTGFFRIIDC